MKLVIDVKEEEYDFDGFSLKEILTDCIKDELEEHAKQIARKIISDKTRVIEAQVRKALDTVEWPNASEVIEAFKRDGLIYIGLRGAE